MKTEHHSRKCRAGKNHRKRTGTRNLERTAQYDVQTIPTAAEVLANGDLIELVRVGTQDLLLRYGASEFTSAKAIDEGNFCYTPTIAARLIRHLPSKPAPYGSTESLFATVNDFICKNSGLDPENSALLSFITFASYFCDCLSTAPCLLLFGSRFQAVSLLRVLGCVCRHAILSVGPSTGWIVSHLRPTRLICELNPRVDRELAALQFSGFNILDAHPGKLVA